MLQNAPKCTISKENEPKIFLVRGHSPSPDPTPVGAFGASIRVPSAFDPIQTTFLDMGLQRDGRGSGESTVSVFFLGAAAGKLLF